MNVQNLKSREQKDPSLRQDMLSAIREKYESLSRSHQRIGEYILEHPREVVYLSITELAERAGVGEATVSRFCWILGLHGFQELKLSLAQDTAGMDGQPKLVSMEVTPNSSLTSAIGQRITQVIAATLESIDEDAMDRACELLVTARKIDFYGVGSSGIMALDASQMFLGMGKFSAAYVDPHIQVMSAALLTQEDVAVAFSLSGSTKDTVTALRKAQESGATTISITSYARSPITQVSDLVLLSSFGEKRVITSMYSKIGEMVVLERLLAGCLMKMEPEAKKASQKIIGAILDKMY